MSGRQRGAFWLLLALVAGQILARLDLPFQVSRTAAPAAVDSSSAVADTSSREPPRFPPGQRPSGARAAPVAPGESLSARIAINRAAPAELQALPRVGPVLAARIVAEREQNGPFRSIQDLQRVPGIGPRTAARLAPLLRFD